MGLSIHLWSRGLTYGAEGSLMGLGCSLMGPKENTYGAEGSLMGLKG